MNLQKTKNQLASSAMRSSAEKKRHIFAKSMIFEKMNDFMTFFVRTSEDQSYILVDIPHHFEDFGNRL